MTIPAAGWTAELDPVLRCAVAGLGDEDIAALVHLGIDLDWAADLAGAGADAAAIRRAHRADTLSRPSRDRGSPPHIPTRPRSATGVPHPVAPGLRPA